MSIWPSDETEDPDFGRLSEAREETDASRRWAPPPVRDVRDEPSLLRDAVSLLAYVSAVDMTPELSWT